MKANIINHNTTFNRGLIRILQNDIGNHTQYIIETESKKPLNTVLNTKEFKIVVPSKFKMIETIITESKIEKNNLKNVPPGLYYFTNLETYTRLLRIADDETELISNIDSDTKISDPSLSKCVFCYDNSKSFLYNAGEVVYPWYKFRKIKVAYCINCGSLFACYADNNNGIFKLRVN